MARARNIKPSFFANDDLADIHPLGRLLFIGLWTLADREGRLEDRPRRIKAEVLPYDDCDVDELLSSLHTHGFVTRYEVDGVKCVQVDNFTKHQDPHYKEKASQLPPPPGHTDSGKTAGGVPEGVRQAVFERDGNKCLGCGSTDDLSIDHVVPRSKGGSHDEDNLQTLCRRCNSAKSNRQAKDDLDQSSANDRPIIEPSIPGQSPLIPDSGFLDSKNPPNPPAGGESPAKPKRERKPRIQLKTFIENCRAAGENAISGYRPLLEYVEATGLPMEFVQLAWDEFKRQFGTGGKDEARLQADWRRHFQNYVEKNYMRLWYAKVGEGGNEYFLTTQGLQAQALQANREGVAA